MTADPTATATPDTDWYDRDTRTIAGVEKLRFVPQVAATGHGTYLTTPSGRQVLDLNASWTASASVTGTPHRRGSHAAWPHPGASLLSGTHPHAVRLAEGCSTSSRPPDGTGGSTSRPRRHRRQRRRSRRPPRHRTASSSPSSTATTAVSAPPPSPASHRRRADSEAT